MKEYKLGEICTFIGGGTPSKSIDYYWNGDIPWASVKDLKEKYISETELSISFDGVKNSSTNIANKDDLILCTRISPGKCAITLKETAINQDLKIVRPIIQNLYINEYLYYQFILLENEIISLSSGSTVKGITLEKIKELQVKLPTIDEQKRIVNILDIVQALIDKRKQAIAKLDELVQALFLDMFGDLRINDKCWGRTSLSEVADIASGITKGKKYNDTKLVAVPYMRVANVQDGYVDLSEIKEIEVSPNDAIRYRLQSRDVLLTEGGDPDKLGRGAVWTAAIKDCIHQNHIFRVRVNEEKLNPYFFSACAGSDYGKNYFLRMAKQTTGIATINMTQLKGFVVYLPPIELQNRFEQLMMAIDMKKQLMNAQLQQLESNFQALLQKAFKGELTVKDGVAV